ncbi:MAG: hypothetical protein Q9185_005819 [Variospora sp. 1 TL-2023]
MSSTPAMAEQLYLIPPLPISKAVYILGACAILAAVIRTVTDYSKLQQFGGPWLASFSKLWMMKHVYDGDMHVAVAQVCEQYGPLARIGPNDLVTNDADLLRRMSAIRSPYTKSEWYSGTQFDHKMNHVFSERDEARHRDIRNRMSSGYSGTENPYLEESVDDRLQDFTNLVRAKYTSTDKIIRRVDFGRLAQYLTLDIITDMAFGEPAGFLSEDGDQFQYLETMSHALPRFEWISCLTWLNALLQNSLVSGLVMPTPEDKTGVGHLMGLAKHMVARRFGSGKEIKQDMLGSYINHGLSQREAETEAVLNIMAGSDTTVTALRAIVLFIISNPAVCKKLQTEIDTAAQKHLLTGHFVRDGEARDLPYLQACIKEGLRVFPPTVGLMQKTVPVEGDVYNGVRIPGGTKIGYCAWGLHRSKAIFGEDADVFRPERWLHVTGDRLLEMNRVVDLVFGSGKYSCLGKPVVFLELRKIVVTLFRQYDIALLDPISPLRNRCANGLFLQTDMWVRFLDRQDPAAVVVAAAQKHSTTVSKINGFLQKIR